MVPAMVRGTYPVVVVVVVVVFTLTHRHNTKQLVRGRRTGSNNSGVEEIPW